jgi:hypothetical protein
MPQTPAQKAARTRKKNEAANRSLSSRLAAKNAEIRVYKKLIEQGWRPKD